jgi:hypothetical protein
MSLQGLNKYFESQDVTITYWQESTTRSFKNIQDFKKFIEEEIEFWRETAGTGGINLIHNNLTKILNHINNALSQADHEKQPSLQQLNQAIDYAIQNNYLTIFSQSKLGIYLKKQFKIKPERAVGIYKYLRERNLSNLLDNNDYFQAALEYLLSDNFEERIKETHQSQVEQLEKLIKSHSKTESDLESSFAATTDTLKKEQKEFSAKGKEWLDGSKVDYDTFVTKTKGDYDTFVKQFSEQISLEEPSKYWENLTTEYAASGRKWKWWAIGCGALSVVILSAFFYNLPDYFLHSTGNSSDGGSDSLFSMANIKGTILLAVIISILVYFVRLFVNLSMSAFHLARDARERYQLTRVYLAMLKANAVDPEHRAIILQSLFSRADTGLL